MPTPRKASAPTTEAIDHFCNHFDDLFVRSEEREAVRQYLIGLLLPREHNKTIVELAAIVPGARRQALHHFLHDAPWDADALNARRLELWRAPPWLGPHGPGGLNPAETRDPQPRSRTGLAPPQYLCKRGPPATRGRPRTRHRATL